MSNPKTSNDPKVIARLLRNIGTGDNPHWKLFNAAADLLDPPTQSRCSADRETVIGADGKSRPITLRQIVARAALSVIEKSDGVETLDWQIADAVLTVLPATEPQEARRERRLRDGQKRPAQNNPDGYPDEASPLTRPKQP